MLREIRRPPISICLVILLLEVFTCHSAVYSPSGGPVYNANNAPAAEIAVQPTQQSNNFITQTVYGFLDFTTTIGNTVMIFSPQSAAPQPKEETVIVTSIIETKPPTNVVASAAKPEIKPSKTVIKATNAPKISSVVHVVGGPAPVANTPVNIQKPVQTVQGKVEVKVEPKKQIAVPQPKQEVHSKVEVKQQAPQSVVVQTQVNVGPTNTAQNQPIILSSIVEVQSSDDDDEEDEDEGIDDDIDDETYEEEQHNHEHVEDEPVIQIGNQIGEPEYDFLSRQPAEYVEETFRVVNLRPSTQSGGKFHKPRPTAEARKIQPTPKNNANDAHPTGLVTKLGGTVVKDGVTTVHETSVIGTFISGKYAQVLQSTSQIFQGNAKPKINPTSQLRILKTAPPSIPKGNRHHNLDPTPASSGFEETAALPVEAYSQSPNLVRSSRRPANPGGSFKNRLRNNGNGKERNDPQEFVSEPVQAVTPSSSSKKPSRNRNNKPKQPKNNSSRFNRPSKSSVEVATVAAYSEPAPSKPNRRNNNNGGPKNNGAAANRDRQSNGNSNSGFKPTSTFAPTNNNNNKNNNNNNHNNHNNNDDSFARRQFKPKLQPTAVDQEQQSTSLYKFKLNRTPGRWQYKTTPKPRIAIRKQTGELETATVQSIDGVGNDIQGLRQEDIDLESSSSINGNVLNDVDPQENGFDKEKKLPIETIKVEISTPADFKDTYYEIATIKSPYTFQVGTMKNTRYVTVTSTFEKILEPEPTIIPSNSEPLTENILATTTHIDKEHNLLDSSIATLPPITLGTDTETPPLETLTETFSTTQLMLKTHILPVIRPGNNATSYTLIQTYHVTRLVTATKTLPPMEIYQFAPSKSLNEFNSRLDEAGSELHLELDFGDENDDEDEPPRRELPSDLDLSNIGSEFDLSEVEKSNIPENLVRPKKKISNHHKPTDSPLSLTPQLSPEQLQQLALLRLLNPAAAAQIPNVITTSKPIVKLETLFESHVIPIFNGVSTSYSTISRPIATVSKTEFEYGTSTIAPQPIPQLPVNPFQQQQPQQQQQFQIQSTPVVTQLIVTATESKILKLTFGAKTAYTTLFSTRVVPTQVTTFITNSVPVVQPTAQFPGYFPAPYPAYPYVG